MKFINFDTVLKCDKNKVINKNKLHHNIAVIF